MSATSSAVPIRPATPPARAFIYRNGAMSLLGGTFGGTNSAATALNDGQEVVGWASTAGNATVHAFLYSGGTMTDLGRSGRPARPSR